MTDPIVMAAEAAEAAKAACIRRIQRAIDATKQLHALPLTAEECITILEHWTWADDIPCGESPEPPPAVDAVDPGDAARGTADRPRATESTSSTLPTTLLQGREERQS